MDKLQKNIQIDERINLLRKKFEGVADAMLINSRENCFYLSGYGGDDSSLLITEDDLIIITDKRYEAQVAYEAPNIKHVISQKNSIDEIVLLSQNKKINKIGFIDSEITLKEFWNLNAVAEGKIEILCFDDFVLEMRSIKTNDEINLIKNAVNIADKALEDILPIIKPGISEKDVETELEYCLKKHGATGTAFDTVVVSGHRSIFPHGEPSDKKIEMGDSVIIDFGAKVDGYCSDISRTVFVGKPSEELKNIYKIVLKAQTSAEEKAYAGKTGKQIDAVARKIIEDNGFAEGFKHGLGHGVGLNVHEEPRLNTRSDQVMKNNMVVTVEPGIYEKGIGGVRIEDIVVINNEEPIILTKASKKMIIL